MGKKAKDIIEELKQADPDQLAGLVKKYEGDDRTGVRAQVEKARRKLEKLETERERVYRMQSFERQYRDYGICCGIDEAGRGPLAGPIVAAAVILPPDCELLYVNDSKKLSPSKREDLFDVIRSTAVSYGIGIVGVEEIDRTNILQADYEAMRRAVAQLSPVPDVLLNDAVRIPGLPMRQVPIIRGDSKSLSIAAASILAKVTRDRMME